MLQFCLLGLFVCVLAEHPAFLRTSTQCLIQNELPGSNDIFDREHKETYEGARALCNNCNLEKSVITDLSILKRKIEDYLDKKSLERIWMIDGGAESDMRCVAYDRGTKSELTVDCNLRYPFVCLVMGDEDVPGMDEVVPAPDVPGVDDVIPGADEDVLNIDGIHRTRRDITTNVTDILSFLNSVQSMPYTQLQTSVGNLSVFVEQQLLNLADILAHSSEAIGSDLIPVFSKLGRIIFRLKEGSETHVTTAGISISVYSLSILEDEGMELSFEDDGRQSLLMIPKEAQPGAGMEGILTYSIKFMALVGFQQLNKSSELSSTFIGMTFLDAYGRILQPAGEILTEMANRNPRPQFDLPTCVTADVIGDEFEGWDTSSCRRTGYTSTSTQCACNKLLGHTVFQVEQKTLGIITWAGCVLPCLASLITSLVIVGYRLTSQLRSYIRLSFLISLGTAESLFLTGMRWSDFPTLCTMFAFLMHFFVTSSLTWMLCYVLYIGNEVRKLATGERSKISSYSYNVIGWLMPSCIAVITLIWRYDDYRDELYCWPTTTKYLYLAFIIPISFFFMMSCVVLVYVIGGFAKSKKMIEGKQTMRIMGSGIRSCMVLIPLLTATWVLAAVTVTFKTLYYQLIFSVTNALLGIFVFLFMCYVNEEIRVARAGRKIIPKTNYEIRAYDTSEELRVAHEFTERKVSIPEVRMQTRTHLNLVNKDMGRVMRGSSSMLSSRVHAEEAEFVGSAYRAPTDDVLLSGHHDAYEETSSLAECPV